MHSIPAMTDMRRTPSEKSEVAMCVPSEYPYGLCISLDTESLKKLNVDFDSIEVGGIYHLFVLGKVTAKSRNENEGGEANERVEIQITHLSAESEDAENQEMDEPLSEKMYKKK